MINVKITEDNCFAIRNKLLTKNILEAQQILYPNCFFEAVIRNAENNYCYKSIKVAPSELFDLDTGSVDITCEPLLSFINTLLKNGNIKSVDCIAIKVYSHDDSLICDITFGFDNFKVTVFYKEYTDALSLEISGCLNLLGIKKATQLIDLEKFKDSTNPAEAIAYLELANIINKIIEKEPPTFHERYEQYLGTKIEVEAEDEEEKQKQRELYLKRIEPSLKPIAETVYDL